MLVMRVDGFGGFLHRLSVVQESVEKRDLAIQTRVQEIMEEMSTRIDSYKKANESLRHEIAGVRARRLRLGATIQQITKLHEPRKMSGKKNCHPGGSWRIQRRVHLQLDPVAPETINNVALGWCEKISGAGNKMTMKTSAKGGFDIEIGSYTVHVPKYSSVHHPLIQMVLFACTLNDSTLRCLKFVAPKSIIEINKSGLLITKPKSHSPNTVPARKDVHALADTAPESHSVTPGLDKCRSVDTAVAMRVAKMKVWSSNASDGIRRRDWARAHGDVPRFGALLWSAPSSADHGITKAEDKIERWRLENIAKAEDDTKDWRLANITKAEDKTEDWQLANITKAEEKNEVTWLMATATVHHATGIRDLLSGFTTIKDLFVKAGDGVSMPVCGRGSVITGTVVLQDVWFVPGLTENLVSVTQLTDLDYSVGFARAVCIIKSATDGAVIGKAHVSEDGLFEVDFLKVGPVI